MTAFELCNSLNWQLFAEEAGSESGVTEANAQPQAEIPSNGPEDFEKLIKGPYKQAYDARVKSILQQRLKSSRETAEKYAAAQPVLELMRQRLGIEGEDYGAMEQALRERLPETNPAGQQRQEAEIQAGADRMVEAWQQRSREIQETYPEFDLEREMLRADFRQLLRARVDMQFSTRRRSSPLPWPMPPRPQSGSWRKSSARRASAPQKMVQASPVPSVWDLGCPKCPERRSPTSAAG